MKKSNFAKKTFTPILIIVGLSISGQALGLAYSWSGLTDFHGIDNFNLFLTGDWNYRKSDVEGRAAVGGSVNIKRFSIGEKAGRTDYSLIAGGRIDAGGTGDAEGGQVNNGGIYAGGGVNIKRVGLPTGDIVSKGDISVTQTTLEDGNVRTASDKVTLDKVGMTKGTITKKDNAITPPFDFDAINLSEMANNFYTEGTALTYDNSRNKGKLLVADCYNRSGTYYFNVYGSVFENAWGFFINAPADTTVIINVRENTSDESDALTISNMDFRLSGGIRAGNILYNFINFKKITMHHIGLFGSILAPGANINFYEGIMTGTLMAKNLTGGSYYDGTNGGQINSVSVPVPEPPTNIMILPGILILLILYITRSFQYTGASEE